ncbi:10209_t:CDS:2 [Diversispora eburnea]|uniref:10209_t:CDS:1 n=1 Tax=Diversispora eburnea TaxID=1213867 RepID=A0A9N9BAT0_9GLOM|nr:10209_t:CDS:2 [Diversispora eburnea]
MPPITNGKKGKSKMMNQSNNSNRVNGERNIKNGDASQLPDRDERFQHVIRLSNERIDVYDLKTRMNEYLGEKSNTYWTAFKRLLYCKIRRQDFESIVRPLLDKEHHEDEEANRTQDDASRDPKRKKIKELIMSLPKEDRKRIKSFKGMGHIENVQVPPPHSEKLPTFNLETQEVLQSGSTRVPTCVEMMALPDRNMLLGMITQIARANGLANVSEECADILNYGLEAHLKNVIGNCLQKTRSGGSSTAPSLGERRRTITARDLAFSVEMSPHILVQPGMVKERMTV